MEPIIYTLLRRWLYTPIIVWQGDWIPRERHQSNKTKVKIKPITEAFGYLIVFQVNPMSIPWRIHGTGISTYMNRNQPNVAKYTIAGSRGYVHGHISLHPKQWYIHHKTLVLRNTYIYVTKTWPLCRKQQPKNTHPYSKGGKHTHTHIIRTGTSEMMNKKTTLTPWN